MRLSQLTAELRVPARNAQSIPEGDPEITGLTFDSRKVEPGMVFVAVVGLDRDGHRYLKQAVARGAAALVVNEAVTLDLGPTATLPVVRVPNSRAALGLLANRFYNAPFTELTSIAITGTNGKSTTTAILESVFEAAGRSVGIIGTIFFRLRGWEIHSPYTTPESVDLYATLRAYLDRGADAVVMEASSHGLALNRLEGATFDAAIFTNLSQDHLDFHSDMESYFQAKRRLFVEHLVNSRAQGKPGIAVVNSDDSYGRRLADELSSTGAPVVRFGLDAIADVSAKDLTLDATQTCFTLRLKSGCELAITLPLVGRFNVLNALAAAAVGEACGLPADAIAAGLNSLSDVPGRLEKVQREDGQGPLVFVDYSHTPDALENALTTLRELDPITLWVVFGCGGDRDRSKRPLMGRVALAKADLVLVTSDNPRTESPAAIVDDIIANLPADRELNAASEIELTTHGWMRIVDRAAAIAVAVNAAPEGGVVLLAGKGHETYQDVNGIKRPFDDREVAAQALESWEVCQ